MSMTPALQGLVGLSHLGVIRARGEDAATFLQGQLTQDVSGLGAGEARSAGYCSAKGRLLASFVVWKPAGDEFALACSADLLSPTLKRLSMFVLRARCRLEDASRELALHGAVGQAAIAAFGLAVPDRPWTLSVGADGSRLLRLPDAAGLPRALYSGTPPSALPALPLEAWRWLEVQSGIPLIEAVNVEQFVPQMVNLELVGGVSFDKGCYPGQEVVARSQYRGTLKRRMALFDTDEAVASAGQEVFHDADPGQPAGRVVNAARRPGGRGSSALIEVKLAALEGGGLHLGSPQGPGLERRPLPYPL